MPRLALSDRRALLDLTGRKDIGNLQLNEVAAAQLAVDRQIEQREVPDAFRDLEANPNGPDVFRQERAFLADDAVLVPDRSTCTNGGNVGRGHEHYVALTANNFSIQMDRTEGERLAALIAEFADRRLD